MFPTPSVSGNSIKLTPLGYFKAGLGVILILTAITLYVFEFDHFDKILDTKYFLILSLSLGLLVDVFLGRHLAKNEHELFEQMRIYMICGMITTVFMPLVISLVNRHLDFKSPQNMGAEILAFKPRADQPFGYIKGEKLDVTHFEWAISLEDKNYKFSTKTLPFPDNKLGDRVNIPVHQGLLGIRYLDFE